MESKISTSQKALIGAIILLVIVSAAFIYFKPHETGFCFTFYHDTQFGDRKVENPINTGILGAGGIEYFPVEIKALQTALKNEGFYIDPYEETGGRVYLSAFFGPSTQSAVRDFQNKYKLGDTGEVGNDTIDKLNELYACPTPEETAPTIQTATTSTTTQ